MSVPSALRAPAPVNQGVERRLSSKLNRSNGSGGDSHSRLAAPPHRSGGWKSQSGQKRTLKARKYKRTYGTPCGMLIAFPIYRPSWFVIVDGRGDLRRLWVDQSTILFSPRCDAPFSEPPPMLRSDTLSIAHLGRTLSRLSYLNYEQRHH